MPDEVADLLSALGSNYWATVQAVPREFAEDALGGLDFIEAQVRTATADGLARRGMTLPATAEVEWWQTPDRDVADPRYTQRVGEPTEFRLTAETRWVRGSVTATTGRPCWVSARRTSSC